MNGNFNRINSFHSLKILMLSRVMPAHQNGGMQYHTQVLAEGLVKRGHRVTVWTTSHKGKLVEVVNGVRICYLLGTDSGSYFNGYWERTRRLIEKLIERHELDFNIIHSQSSAGLGVINMGVPMVTTFHGTALDEVKTKINLMTLDDPISFLKMPVSILRDIYGHFRYAVKIANNSDALIAISNEQEEIYNNIYRPRQVYKVFTGTDEKFFRSMNVPRHQNSILMVCRIEKDKGIQYMVKAMPEVLKSIPDAILRIVGEGSYKPTIQKLVDNLGLHDKVDLSGTVLLDDLPETYNSYSIFVNSTIRQNGYDLTILEAMACGKPIICTNIGSIPTVINNGKNGLLIGKKNISELSNTVISLLTNEEERMWFSKQARKTILNKFTNDRMVDETIRVYEEVIGNYKYSHN